MGDEKDRSIDELPKKNPLSLQIDLSKFELATDDEKKQQDRMREASSFFKDGMKKFKQNKISVACLILVIVFILIAFIVPLFYPYDYKTISGNTANSNASQYLKPFEYSRREQILKAKSGVFVGWSVRDTREHEYYGLTVIESEEEFEEVKEYLVKDSLVLEQSEYLYAVWIVDKDGDGQPDFGSDYFNYSGVTQLADRLKLTYDLNGGTGTLPVDDFEYVKTDSIVPSNVTNDFVKEGYKFIGWSKKVLPVITVENLDENKADIIAKNFTMSEDTTIYAVWAEEEVSFKVDYKSKTKAPRYSIFYDGNMSNENAPLDNGVYAKGDKVVPNSTISLTKRTEKVFPHILGTDEQGRDYAIRTIVGMRVSLLVGIIAAVVVVIIGVIYGAISGYFGGKVDLVMMRIVDLIYSLPDTLIIILLSVMFRQIFGNSSNADFVAKMGGSGLLSILIVFALLYWVGMARLVRGQVLSLREQEFVLAAKASGAKPWWIIKKHMLPNCISVIFITAALQIPSAIFTESFLSYLGIGVSVPMPSLGSLASNYRGQMTTEGRLYLFLVPALIIFLLVLSLNLLGQGLRDAFDPKLKSRKKG